MSPSTQVCNRLPEQCRWHDCLFWLLCKLLPSARAPGVSDIWWVLQLEELAITGEEHVHPNSWAIGLSSVPDSWSNLKSLRTLQLQGHTVLEVRPCTCRCIDTCALLECQLASARPEESRRKERRVRARAHGGNAAIQ